MEYLQKHIIMYVNLANFIKTKRKEANLTQQEFAEKAGVALTVVRKIEQGKENLSLSKVNQVLLMFGSKLVPANLKSETITQNLLTVLKQRY